MPYKVKHEHYNELRKLINSWDLEPGLEFDELNAHLFKSLQSGLDENKIMSILDSELVLTYGLSPTKSQLKGLTKQIINWWISKR